jgi:ribonuclease P protein component
VRAKTAGFPKAVRLLKTDEFSSVFRLRPWARSAHFVLYGRASAQPARLGVVVGKKQAPRAVTRNLVKRLVRETFRLRAAELDGWDVLIRLSGRIDRAQFSSAASKALTRALRAEIDVLVERAVREAARRAASGAAPAQANAFEQAATSAQTDAVKRDSPTLGGPPTDSRR